MEANLIARVSNAVAGIRDHLDREPTLSNRPFGTADGTLMVSVQGWDNVTRPMRTVRAALTAAGIPILRDEVVDVGDEDCPKTWGAVYVALPPES